jgi:hypothetical protein
VPEDHRLIEKVYVRDQDGNTVELKTYLCPDGSTKTERRLAINSKGELHGKFRETGVDLNDVMQIEQHEITRMIQEHAMKSAQKSFTNSVTPTKSFNEDRFGEQNSMNKHVTESPLQPTQFSTFQHIQQPKSYTEEEPTGPKPQQESKQNTEEKENLNRTAAPKSAQSSPLSQKNQNQLSASPRKPEDQSSKPPTQNSSAPGSARKVISSKGSTTLQMPPGIAASIKGKAIKVRYKDVKGKTYPVGVSGPELTKTEKEWLLRKMIEKEGLTIEEVEEIEGGHLIDTDDGSEYRLTADMDQLQHDLADTNRKSSKNNRGSNLVKDIQNQIINEQDEEVVSHSSAYPSNRLVPGFSDQNAPIQKFDLMHRPPDSVSSKTDEIWFRTREQKVLDEPDAYRGINMSKSSAKSPMQASHQEMHPSQSARQRAAEAQDFDSPEKDLSTKFNYGTGQQYNPGFSPKYDSGSDKKAGTGYKEQEEDNQYDPSDIDALLRHNENLLSKIKIDMKNIGESFVSHTDMGSSRVGLKNNLSGVYNNRNADFDSKDMINRSPIGIQEFESFKTKTNEVRFSLTVGQIQGVQSSNWAKAWC